MSRIEEVSLQRLEIPLTVPYKLAFGSVSVFDTILARIALDGRTGLGEATILNGYTHERIEQSWARAAATGRRLPGLSAAAAKDLIARELLEVAPFAATALTTAIEMAEGHPLLRVEEPAHVPLLAGVNATDDAGIEHEMEAAIAAGFGTLKIKVGFEIEPDLRRVRLIQRLNRGRARLRIDANQGFGRDDGCRFASSLDPRDIELLEQPCDAADWEANAAVIAVSAVPLMLDESIYTSEDVDRAARIGARFVKLKLMKMGSLDALAAGLDRIRELGMEPVLGNGVASDIGCWMEACVARTRIASAGEFNGFQRQRQLLSVPPIPVANGTVLLAAGYVPALDDRRLVAFTCERIAVRRDSRVVAEAG